MNIERIGAVLAVACLGSAANVADAQVLSPPVAAAAPGGSAPVAGLGSGPGFHDPRSPFKPLEEREGVVSWKLLGTVKVKVEKSRTVPVFPPAVQALDSRPVKVQGFMMPLEPGDRQRHFLLSSVPTSCGFCVPAGPEGLVEVRTKAPVRYTLEPVTVEGKLAVLESDPYGVFYRIAEATESR
jgi:hypothetical protein